MQTLSVLLGKRIKEIRESKNIKQVELANMIDIEPTNLSKIEKGVHLPKDETINKILNALNTDINNLFEFEHIKEKDDLLNNINLLLSEAKTEDLQFFYRVIISYNETKRK
ncbi:helix-turn-helix transcriptional regulator [bacterium]|nr:helix-turn-helix transcriptional regulator [bacterium]